MSDNKDKEKQKQPPKDAAGSPAAGAAAKKPAPAAKRPLKEEFPPDEDEVEEEGFAEEEEVEDEELALDPVAIGATDTSERIILVVDEEGQRRNETVAIITQILPNAV